MRIIPTCFEVYTNYDCRVVALKLSQTRFVFSFVRFFAFHTIIVWAWHVWSGHTRTTERLRYMQARLHVGSDELAKNYLCVSRSSFIVFSINLVCLKTIQSSRERYCVYITCGCSVYTRRWVRERDTSRFRSWVLVSSNRLDPRSVWKSLAGS